MSHSTLKSALLELGFSANDADVYLGLTDLTSGDARTVPAGRIIEHTGLHRNIVYTSLNHLVARKLAQQRQVKGVQHFSPADPAVLRDEFSRKAALAERTARSIGERLPAKRREITIHEGNEEYLQLLSACIRSMPVRSTKYVLGAGGVEFMQATMLPIWDEYHRLARARKLKIKLIGYEHQRKSILPALLREKQYEVRFLDDALENPAGIHIYPAAGTVLNVIYSDAANPVHAIRMRHEALVQSHLTLFRNLWTLAKK